MAFHWNPYSIPEFELLPKEERKRIWKKAWRGAAHRWELIVVGLLVGALPWAGNMLLQANHVRSIFRWIFVVACIIAAQAVHQHWLVTFLRPRIWAQLPGLCTGCGYDTRATPERCPECGLVVTKHERPS